MNTKQSFTEIESFLAKWKKKPIAFYRMGQHFCNTYNITDSKLFYEVNDGKAEKMIWADYYNPARTEQEQKEFDKEMSDMLVDQIAGEESDRKERDMKKKEQEDLEYEKWEGR
jgi:hypothetical protein